MYRILWVSLLIAGLALAQATLRLTINGQASSTPAITVNGKVYVPLEALQKAGMGVSRSGANLGLSFQPPQPVAAGGANQRASLEGCLGETLFNGIWRVRASKLEAIVKDAGTPIETAGWGITVEFRSAAKNMVQPVFTGLADQGIQVAFDDAQTLTTDVLDVQKLTYANLPPGGAITHQLKFWYKYDTPKDQIKTPTKLLLEINTKGFENTIRQSGASYTTPSPSLRIRLDCQK
ncbi:MAG: hypothetical protein SFU83_22995 [Meiothermus sp.]|nr:hypothetical protein [Meiothermus sp.]